MVFTTINPGFQFGQTADVFFNRPIQSENLRGRAPSAPAKRWQAAAKVGVGSARCGSIWVGRGKTLSQQLLLQQPAKFGFYAEIESLICSRVSARACPFAPAAGGTCTRIHSVRKNQPLLDSPQSRWDAEEHTARWQETDS